MKNKLSENGSLLSFIDSNDYFYYFHFDIPKNIRNKYRIADKLQKEFFRGSLNPNELKSRKNII
jgi:hypothetical protein